MKIITAVVAAIAPGGEGPNPARKTISSPSGVQLANAGELDIQRPGDHADGLVHHRRCHARGRPTRLR